MGENVAATDGQFTARTKEIGVCTYSRNVFLGADADRAGTLVYTGLSYPTPIFAVRAGLRDKKKVWIQTACHAEMPTGEIVGKGACRKRYWRWLRLAQ